MTVQTLQSTVLATGFIYGETLANRSISGHLRSFSDQPGSKISPNHARLLDGAGRSSTR